MKKNNILLWILFGLMLSHTACNTYTSMSAATKVTELKGNPFMYQLSKAVIKNLGNYAVKSGSKHTGKIQLLSTISSIFSTDDQIAGLKDLLTLSYKISPQKINKDFSKLVTIKDLISFVEKNGKGFNFYSRNTSL